MSVRLSRRHRFAAAMFVFAAIFVFRGAGRGQPGRRDRAAGSPLGLPRHEPGDPGHAERRHRQSRHAVGARRRGAVETAGGTGPSLLRRLPRRRGREHARRRRPPSRLQPGAAAPDHLEERINLCRAGQQKAAPLTWESPALLGLTAYVAHQSRGLPIAAGDDERRRPFVDAGRQLFAQRQGQLNLSCAECHDRPSGRAARGQSDPAGTPDRLSALSPGMAEHRLAAAAPAQLHDGRARRALRYGSPEFADLELYPHVARARAAARDAGRAAISQCDPFDAETEQVSERLKLTCRFSPRGAGAL